MLASWSSHCRVDGCWDVPRRDPPYIPGLSRHLSQCLWSSLIQTFLCEQFLLCHYSDGRIFWGIESDSDNIMKVPDREESIKQIYNMLLMVLFVYYVDNTIRFSLAMTSHHDSEFIIVFYWTADLTKCYHYFYVGAKMNCSFLARGRVQTTEMTRRFCLSASKNANPYMQQKIF